MKRVMWIALGLLAGGTMLPGLATPTGDPVEIGRVKWNLDFDRATRLTRDSAKPMLLLFQEIPG